VHAKSNSLTALWPHLLMKYVSRVMGAYREDEKRVQGKMKF
jgi:hypothetical protein